MLKTIKAKFTDGILVPLEPLEFAEGQEILITLDSKPDLTPDEKHRISMSAAGGWAGSIDGEELKRRIYADRRASIIPTPDQTLRALRNMAGTWPGDIDDEVVRLIISAVSEAMVDARLEE